MRSPVWVGFALAVLAPLVAQTLTASAFDYWLDSGEFVAAATTLGIAHPPGQPLHALFAAAACLVPIGSLSLRVALASAGFTSLAVGFVFLCSRRVVRSVGIADDRVACALALASAWLVGSTHAWWLQGVRPEVYGLQAALVLFCLERLTAVAVDPAASPWRALRPAAFAFGLGLANHHLLTLLVVPPALFVLWRHLRGRSLIRRGQIAAFATLGCLTYVYLPIRSLRNPMVNLGEPTTLEGFLWVVSARVFQKNTGSNLVQPLAERVADVVVQLVSAFPLPVLLFGAAAAYVLLRHGPTRAVGMLWLLVLAVFGGARAWLGYVRSNPDALGYLMTAIAALAILACGFTGALIVTACSLRSKRPAGRTPGLSTARLLAAACLVPFLTHAGSSSLAGFAATDLWDDLIRRDLPPRAIVFASAPQTVFRYWGGDAVEQLRPDVTFVPLPFVPYPGVANRLARQTPELRPLLVDLLTEGRLRSRGLETLAARQPTLLELDVRIPRDVYPSLAPARFYFDVLSGPAVEEELRYGGRRLTAGLARLERLLGNDRADPETSSQLLWKYYVDALFFAATGDLVAAEDATDAGLAINPDAGELRALRERLSSTTSGPGPIDITPFLPH